MDNQELVAIIEILKGRGLSIREIARQTGIDASDLAKARLGSINRPSFLPKLRELLQSHELDNGAVAPTHGTVTTMTQLVAAVSRDEADIRKYSALVQKAWKDRGLTRPKQTPWSLDQADEYYVTLYLNKLQSTTARLPQHYATYNRQPAYRALPPPARALVPYTYSQRQVVNFAPQAQGESFFISLLRGFASLFKSRQPSAPVAQYTLPQPAYRMMVSPVGQGTVTVTELQQPSLSMRSGGPGSGNGGMGTAR